MMPSNPSRAEKYTAAAAVVKTVQECLDEIIAIRHPAHKDIELVRDCPADLKNFLGASQEAFDFYVAKIKVWRAFPQFKIICLSTANTYQRAAIMGLKFVTNGRDIVEKVHTYIKEADRIYKICVGVEHIASSK